MSADDWMRPSLWDMECHLLEIENLHVEIDGNDI
jgi:hypothetical protein